MATLQGILDSKEWLNLRHKFMTLISEPDSQILEPL